MIPSSQENEKSNDLNIKDSVRLISQVKRASQNPQEAPPLESVIGVDNFLELATKYARVYVDKTPFIRQILEKYESRPIMILTRPKGWGKTTNLTMLKQFIEPKVDDKGKIIRPHPNFALFAGGEMKVIKYFDEEPEPLPPIDPDKTPTIFDFIMKSEQMHKLPNIKKRKVVDKFNLRPLKMSRIIENGIRQLYCQKDFGTHPVIFVDFGKIRGNNYPQLRIQLLTLILDAYKAHSYLTKTSFRNQYNIIYKHIAQIVKAPEKSSSNPLDILFSNLIDILQQCYKGSCYLLVDNYDEPLIKILRAQDLTDVKKMAVLIASLFSDFQIKHYIPPSSNIKFADIRGKRNSCARAILFGKCNIFSGYLNCCQHYSVGNPHFYAEFGLSHQQIKKEFLNKVLQSLRDRWESQLNEKHKFHKIKEQLEKTIKCWYGGYAQQIQPKQDELVQKCGFGTVWKYLHSFISNGTIAKGKCFDDEESNFDEKWFLNKFIDSMTINQVLQFQDLNSTSYKVLISDFLAIDQNHKNLSVNDLMHIGYSLGYVTGYFLPSKQGKTHLLQSHFPNLQVIAKCKNFIMRKMLPSFYVFGESQNFDLINLPIFKQILERIVNNFSIAENRDIFEDERFNNALIKGIIYYRVLSEPNSGYASAAEIQQDDSLEMDHLFMKTRKEEDKTSEDFNIRVIHIRIKAVDTTDRREIERIFIQYLRQAFESLTNLKRIINLMEKQTDIPVDECMVIIRLGAMTYESKHPSYQLDLISDFKFTYPQMLDIFNFFESFGQKWEAAHFYRNSSLSYREYTEEISLLSNGQAEKVIKKARDILTERQQVRKIAQQKKIEHLMTLNPKQNEQELKKREEEELFEKRSRYNQQAYEAGLFLSGNPLERTQKLEGHDISHVSDETSRNPYLKFGTEGEMLQVSRSKNILVNYSTAYDKKSFYYYNNTSGWDNTGETNSYRTRKFTYPNLEKEDNGESGIGQLEKRLYGRKQFKQD